jgi:hypothetical protein
VPGLVVAWAAQHQDELQLRPSAAQRSLGPGAATDSPS